MAINKRMPILVVDDYKTMLRIIRNLLAQIGFKNVDDATDAEAAFEKLEKHHEDGKPFEMIISDWNMDPMTGLDFLKKVREDERFKEVPFIMVTAETQADNVIEARDAGVNNYIVKPFNATTLKAKIAAVLGDF